MTTVVTLRIRTDPVTHGETILLFPPSLIASSWVKGEMRSLRRFHADSGANIDWAEAETTAEAVNVATERLLKARTILGGVRRLRGEMELDFGIEITGDKPMVSIEFGSELQKQCSELEIVLKVSAYVCSHDDLEPPLLTS